MLEIRSYHQWREGDRPGHVDHPSFEALVHCTLCGQTQLASANQMPLTARCCTLWVVEAPQVYAKKVPSPSSEPKVRCPHDGGACHHGCTGECFRKKAGMRLTKPWEGYPVEGDGPVTRIECLMCHPEPCGCEADD